MWCSCALLLLSLSVVTGEEVAAGALGAGARTTTTRAPPRTLDRKAAELAWRSWLQSPESGNANAPPRRITTKSLFITPLVCPKGQRLDRNGCVQIVTVNKDEHERILLEQLNALFTAPPSGDIQYDYGDDEPGPLQLSIPIGLDPLASPLQANEPSSQAQELRPNYIKIDKKEEKPMSDASIEAELEILKLQQISDRRNYTSSKTDEIVNFNTLNNILSSDKPNKRDSPAINASDVTPTDYTKDEGQKEQVFGHVNIDPILLHMDETTEYTTTFAPETETPTTLLPVTSTIDETTLENKKATDLPHTSTTKTLEIIKVPQTLKGDQAKLNPENDYSDIGEAIKLISRYAAVTTDDNFSKEHNKSPILDDNILGTRTKLQYRRNKPKPPIPTEFKKLPPGYESNNINMLPKIYNNDLVYYRYSWPNQNPTPPPDYPFRRIQDYWPNWKQVGGVYNTMTHENPKRHHHSFAHNYFRSRGYRNYSPNFGSSYPGLREAEQLRALGQRLPHSTGFDNQNLYSLLGLRHWFSSDGTSKR